MTESSTDSVRGILSALSHERPSGRRTGGPPLPFITLSRQTGAGGHTLAEALLAEMARCADRARFGGWRVWDHELCAAAVAEPGVRASLKELEEEEFRSPLEDLLNEQITGCTPQDVVLGRIFRMMHAQACAGRAILLGRGGVCLTRDLPGGVHVRLVAPESLRVRRLRDLLRTDEREARRVLRHRDENRAGLVRGVFKQDIDDPCLYDMTWNTGAVPFDEIARAVVALAQRRADELAAKARGEPLHPQETTHV